MDWKQRRIWELEDQLRQVFRDGDKLSALSIRVARLEQRSDVEKMKDQLEQLDEVASVWTVRFQKRLDAVEQRMKDLESEIANCASASRVERIEERIGLMQKHERENITAVMNVDERLKNIEQSIMELLKKKKHAK